MCIRVVVLIPAISCLPSVALCPLQCLSPLFCSQRECIFCCTSSAPPAKRGSLLESTAAKCSPYSSSLEIICKNGLHFAIRYPPLRFQASLSECCISYEIDKSIFFANNFSLYLRMCIFCCTFVASFNEQRWRGRENPKDTL